MADLAIDSAGNLFGFLEPGSDDLYSISKATGLATLVGDSPSSAVSGIAFNSADVLYFEDVGTLHTLSTVTGASLGIIGSSGLLLGMGVAFDPADVLYALERIGTGVGGARALYTVDTTTGAATFIGATTGGMDALEFVSVPAPATLLLLAAGLAGIGFTRRRQRAAA